LTICASSGCAASEAEALELKEEFARRLGEQQRTIDILKVIVTASAATAALSGRFHTTEYLNYSSTCAYPSPFMLVLTAACRNQLASLTARQRC
jgi:hypothetical protein